MLGRRHARTTRLLKSGPYLCCFLQDMRIEATEATLLHANAERQVTALQAEARSLKADVKRAQSELQNTSAALAKAQQVSKAFHPSCPDFPRFFPALMCPRARPQENMDLQAHSAKAGARLKQREEEACAEMLEVRTAHARSAKMFSLQVRCRNAPVAGVCRHI